MDYKVKRSLTGVPSIHLSCRKCQEAVVFDLDDAGKVMPCPACAFGIRVPGENEKQAEAMRQKAKEAEERQRSEAYQAAAMAHQVADAKRQALAAAEAQREREAKEYAERWRYSVLTGTTWTLGIFGTISLVVASAMDTSVRAGDFDRVQNIGLLNTRLCLVIFGCACILGSVVASSASQVIKAMGWFAQQLDWRLTTSRTSGE